jgi:hypothetical protein
MRPALLLVLLFAVAASPAAAQSCATLGGGLDCGGAPARLPAKVAKPPVPANDADAHGYSESKVSNHGASTTFNSSVIDSHGVMELGVNGSTRRPCRLPGYGSACE